jgi:uncharacterized protein YbaR (Trm112 family)
MLLCVVTSAQAKYRPSDLMCPFYREWVPLEECIPRFQYAITRHDQRHDTTTT